MTHIKNLLHRKWIVVGELIIALLLIALYIRDYLPFSEIPFLFIFGWLSLRLRGLGWRTVGFKRPPGWRKAILSGVAAGIAAQLFCIFVIEPVTLRLTGESADLSQFATIKGNVFLLVFFLVLVWTVAAFGEELIYRGYLMNRVAELGGGGRSAWAASLVVVSIIFGVAHWNQDFAGVVANIAAGLVYGGLYLWSGRNLRAPIIAHGTYDTFGLLLIFWGVG